MGHSSVFLKGWGAAAGAAVFAGLFLTAGVARAEDRKPFEVGVFGGFHIFNKDHGLGRYEGDPEGTSPSNGFMGGLRLAWAFSNHLAAEVEGGFTHTDSRDGTFDYNIFLWRAHLAFDFLDSGAFRPFILAGAGGHMSRSSDKAKSYNDNDGELHAGLGARYHFTDAISLRLDGRIITPPAFASDVLPLGDESHYGGPDFEVLLGLTGHFGGEPPAPPPPADSDGDGLNDNVDKCPQEAEDKDGFQDDDGCPDLDNDGDGVPDKADKCPDKAETKNGIEDEDGCPETDTDGDGVLDPADKCVNDPEDKDGFQDEDGCPDPDNDNDGVKDADDKCGDKPETMNGFEDGDGCPDELPKEVAKFTGKIEGINFKLNSAEITKDSFKTLDKAVDVLKQFGDLRLEVSGHTDDTGARDHNMELSAKRAESVKTYFVGKGIDAARLSTVGYGPDKPMAEGKTAKARAQNRRIEFRLLTGQETAAPAAAPAK